MSRQRATSLVFGATMALAGFLLFQVQPLLGKYLLPWFGGSAATWLVCLMFFQLALLAGYMHAYAVTLPLAVPRQVWAQLAVLAAGLLLLPITPAETWKPVDASDPTWRIVALLALSVGLPYMVLATTTPLLSRWLAHLEPSLDPARFYAASNLGSFAGLLSYPFLFERLLASQEQTLWWSWAYGLYALLFAACGVVTLLRAGSTDTAGAAQPMRGRGGRPVLAWIGLAALGSGLLLATTNAVGQWSAVVPFLWVVPLAVYLLSFVIAFGAPQLHRPTMFSAAFLLLAGAVFLPGAPESTPSFLTQLALNAATLFAGLMLCHGELARRTPEAAELPHFYLAIAAGGALGGALVTVAAPLAFTDYFEHPLLLAAVAALAVALMLRTPNGDAARRLAAATAGVALLCFVAGFAVGLWRELAPERALIERVRNFYGVVKVVREDGEGGPPSLVMEQAGVEQGSQVQGGEWRMEPSCAFGRASALALALTYTAKRRADTASPLRIGVVGLGAGMVAAHGRPGDRLRYYELNPAVLTLVERHFTYVKDGKADTDVLLGDGRLL